MKLLFYTLILVLTSFNSFAQTPNKSISGIVKDTQNEPIPAATIKLMKIRDSTLVQGKIANANGKFEFTHLESGTYSLNITAVGNRPYKSVSITLDDAHPTISLPVIILLPAKNVNLKEVTVTAKKPLVEQEIDKTVINVESMASAATSNTLEVLEKTPGVTVDNNGEISLNGKNGVLVLIEGRPTYMSGEDLAAYLKSLPGGALDRIELMTNPPARYDANGNAIINIRLKRNKVQGFNGSLNLSYNQGTTTRSYDALNINFMKKKINIFGNLSYSRDANYSKEFSDRTLTNSEGNTFASIKVENRYRNSSDALSGRFGMDFTLSTKTIIGFNINLNNRPRQGRLDYVNKTYDISSTPDSISNGFTDGNFKWMQTGANINFQHKFDNKGRELSADLNYINYNTDGEQIMPNFVYSQDGTLIRDYEFLYVLPSDKHIYTAKVDYTHPFKNKAKFETGIKSSFVEDDNLSQYYNVIDGANIIDNRQSNHFIYKENINAAYVNAQKDWKRWGVQLGLRLENTQLSGNQLGNAEVAQMYFSRSYSGLFPTAFLSYKLDSLGNHSLNLNYSSRINRPNYQQLNPFVFYRDSYTYSAGNPYLNPTYNYRVEISYRYKRYLNLQMQYDKLKDNIFDATEAVGDIFIRRPTNMANGYLIALIMNLNLSPTKWWTINLNTGVGRFFNEGQVGTETIRTIMFAGRANLFSQFKLKKDWGAELSGNFVSRMNVWQRIIEPRYRLNTAVQKKILKGKGNLKFSIEDIFHTGFQKSTLVGLKQATSYTFNIQDTRRVGLSFNYNFGKETFARKRRHNDNAADSEKDRVDN